MRDLSQTLKLIDEPTKHKVQFRADFRHRRICEQICSSGVRVFTHGNRGDEGITRLEPEPTLQAKQNMVDLGTRSWRESPPEVIKRICTYLELIHAECPNLGERTTYEVEVTSARQLPRPTELDLANFIFDNCHKNQLLENILIILTQTKVNLIRDGESQALDGLSLLFFRYPAPRGMRALRLPYRTVRTFFDLLQAGGYQQTGHLSHNLLDLYKLDVKRFCSHLLRGARRELQLTNEWFEHLFRRPNMSRYGESIIPIVPKSEWSFTHSQPEPSPMPSIIDLGRAIANAGLLGASSQSFACSNPIKIDASEEELSSLLLRFGCAFGGCIDHETKQVQLAENASLYEIGFRLNVSHEAAYRNLELSFPFGCPVIETNETTIPPTSRMICHLFDRLRDRDCLPRIANGSGPPTLLISLPKPIENHDSTTMGVTVNER